MTRWTVYTRAGCGLCEELLVELQAVLSPGDEAAVTLVDVDTAPDLARRYAHRIPVLEADGEFVCAGHLDLERVRTVIALAAQEAHSSPSTGD